MTMINAKCYIDMDNMYTQVFHSHFIFLVTKMWLLFLMKISLTLLLPETFVEFNKTNSRTFTWKRIKDMFMFQFAKLRPLWLLLLHLPYLTSSHTACGHFTDTAAGIQLKICSYLKNKIAESHAGGHKADSWLSLLAHVSSRHSFLSDS